MKTTKNYLDKEKKLPYNIVRSLTVRILTIKKGGDFIFKEELHIGFEIHTLDKMIGSSLHSLFIKEDITKMQSWFIHYLYEHKEEDVYQRDLENFFHIARSTATGILQTMEKRGYLTREISTQDSRLKRLLLTDKARRLEEQVLENILHTEATLKTDLSEEEISTFVRIVRKMRANVESNKQNANTQETERSRTC